jgi:hypothetical protein
MKHALLAAGLLIFAFITQTGCAAKPDDELQMVKTAMEQAQDREASTYAPYDWDRARWDWEMANSLIAMGRYSEARNILVLAVGKFDSARDTATSRLEAVKSDVTTLQAELKLELDKLEQVENKAGTRQTVKQRIDRALPLIEQKFAAMQAAVDDKSFLEARTDGNQALHELNNLRKKLGIAP